MPISEENGKVIRFLFAWGELAQETQEDEEISYVRGYKPISMSRSGKDRNYFVQDEMGSTLFLLDQNHEIQKTYRYDVFGNLLKEMGNIPNRLTYTGQMYDGAVIQYYLRVRFYNPAIGWFMQGDTYRGDGLNLYAYCANNPVVYYDPRGYAETPQTDDGCHLMQKLRETVIVRGDDNRADFYVTPNGDGVPSTGYRYMPSDNASDA